MSATPASFLFLWRVVQFKPARGPSVGWFTLWVVTVSEAYDAERIMFLIEGTLASAATRPEARPARIAADLAAQVLRPDPPDAPRDRARAGGRARAMTDGL